MVWRSMTLVAAAVGEPSLFKKGLFCTENDHVNRFLKVLKRNFEPYFALGWPFSFTMMVSLR